MAMSGNSLSGSELITRFADLIKNGYEILDFSECDLKHKDYKVIALDRKKVLGRGSYGNVFLAYPIDPDTSTLVKSKQLAVKVYKNVTSVNKSEASFFDAYNNGCELITNGHDIYMVMTCIPGYEVMEMRNDVLTLNSKFTQLDFSHRVDMVCNIMMSINPVHHNTPRTGSALVHGDINGSNIKVNYNRESDVFDVYIIDFGLAKKIEDDPDTVQQTVMEGTPLFMPNELVEHEVHGVKSDIYALTPIFAAIFGADNPFAQRSKVFWGYQEYFKIPYDFSGMFEGYEMRQYPCDVKAAITKFLQRMQKEAMDERPDSDEALKFFTMLNKLCKTFEANPSDPDIAVCAAKLAMLAEGLWSREDVDDPEKEPVAEAIVEAAGQTPLSSPVLRKIISSDNFLLLSAKSKRKTCSQAEVAIDEEQERLIP